jgi:aromatic ring-opening dioxygenase LigB subunit
MPLVFAAVAPHGAPVFDDPEGATRRGMEELGRRFAAAAPEAVIVLTPHGLQVDGSFVVVRSVRLEGDASQWTDADTQLAIEGDPELADACVEAMRADGLPALGATFGSSLAAASTMPLDWGALIPLWFMRAPAVVVSPCRELAAELHLRAGAALARATGERRVALVASADHGHGHVADGPYGFGPESADYDTQVLRLIRANRLDTLELWDPAFVRAAMADSWWQLLMLHGAIGPGWEAQLLSYEVPTYFGMACAAFTPRSSGPGL